jgi:hypothetical protein
MISVRTVSGTGGIPRVMYSSRSSAVGTDAIRGCSASGGASPRDTARSRSVSHAAWYAAPPSPWPRSPVSSSAVPPAAASGHGDSVIAWDDLARPARFSTPVTRDEQEQAAYLTSLLETFSQSGLDAAFVNTFARYDLPHHDTDDDRDYDKASFGIVKVLPSGSIGTGGPPVPHCGFRDPSVRS